MEKYPGGEPFDQRTDQAGIAIHLVIGYRSVTIEYIPLSVMTAPCTEEGAFWSVCWEAEQTTGERQRFGSDSTGEIGYSVAVIVRH